MVCMSFRGALNVAILLGVLHSAHSFCSNAKIQLGVAQGKPLIALKSESFRDPSISQHRSNARALTRMQEAKQGEGPFGVRPDKLPDVLTASLASLARLGSGGFVAGYRAELNTEYKNPSFGMPVKEYSESLPSIRPAKPLELYEFEACPYCRKVREALSMLDIDAIVYPCPKDGSRYRPKVIEKGGKAQFPYLIDPNTQFAGYESDAIVKYLFQTYGDGIVPLQLCLGPLTLVTSAAATTFRQGRGRQAAPGLAPAPPAAPVELWGYELSPFVRLVRETLCELELPYKSVTVARGSPKREQLKARAGRFQVPYLVDPNTGVEMFESADIIDYLERTYGAGAGPAGSTAAAAPAPAPAADEAAVKVEAELVEDSERPDA